MEELEEERRRRRRSHRAAKLSSLLIWRSSHFRLLLVHCRLYILLQLLSFLSRRLVLLPRACTYSMRY